MGMGSSAPPSETGKYRFGLNTKGSLYTSVSWSIAQALAITIDLETVSIVQRVRLIKFKYPKSQLALSLTIVDKFYQITYLLEYTSRDRYLLS